MYCCVSIYVYACRLFIMLARCLKRWSRHAFEKDQRKPAICWVQASSTSEPPPTPGHHHDDSSSDWEEEGDESSDAEGQEKRASVQIKVDHGQPPGQKLVFGLFPCSSRVAWSGMSKYEADLRDCAPTLSRARSRKQLQLPPDKLLLFGRTSVFKGRTSDSKTGFPRAGSP